MAETLMAGFAQNEIEVRALSEANAVTYRLVACSATAKSVPLTSYVYLNDVAYGSQTHGTGINIRVFNDANDIVSTRSFATTPNESTINTGFVDFISTLNPFPLVLITTYGNTRCSQTIDDWFKSVGSVAWPGAYLFNNYNYAYVGVYSSVHKKILSEVYYGDDAIGSGKGRAKLEVIYDTPSDIGMLGFPNKAVYDPAEYSSNTAYEFRRYPVDGQLISPMADYGISPSTKVAVYCDLYASQALFTNNMSTRLSVRWYNGTTIVGSSSVDVPKAEADKWYKTSLLIDVPANANGFTMVAARYPRNDAVNAKGGIRNAMLTQIIGNKTSRMAAIGVNGIVNNELIDGTSVSNLLTEIHDSTKLTDNPLELIGIKELELEY